MENELAPFSQILIKTCYRCAIIAALFMTISTFGMIFSAYQTRLAYGWIYEQIIMINGETVTNMVYVKDQFAFGGIMLMISAFQWANVALIKRFILNFN